MKNKKLVLAIAAIAICLAIPIGIYVGVAVSIGYQVYDLVESSFQHQGKNHREYSDVIREEDYVFLDYSRGFHGNWRKNYHTFPLVIHDFRKATAKYTYTIDGNSHGGWDIHVTVSLERRNGIWYVTHIDEPA